MNDVVDVAKGAKHADRVIKNGKIVNVYTKEIYEGGVAICGEYIAAVGDVDYTIGPDTIVVDAAGGYLLPGFVDAHIHPESANLAMAQFAEIVMVHGTTSVMSDLHEVGVVGGMPAIEHVLNENADTPLKLYFVIPSHVPFSAGLETSGGVVDSAVIREALKRPDAVGLSEIVNVYAMLGFPDLMKSLEYAKEAGVSLQGHLPESKGPELQALAAMGISSDHESLSGEDAVERARVGMNVFLREGSAARNLKDTLAGLTANNIDLGTTSIITDDLHTCDAVDNGHLDAALRSALEYGLDFAAAVQLVTLNPARAFRLDDKIGSLTPGRLADVNITTGPEDFRVKSVYAGGKLVAEEGKPIKRFPVAKHDPSLFDTIHLMKPVAAEDFYITVDKNASYANVMAMETLDWIPITVPHPAKLAVKDGRVLCDTEQDVLYIAQVERYGKNGNIGKAFMAGFHLKEGAIASSIGHDNHNIIVMGANTEDMAVAVNRLAEIGGGQIVVNKGKVIDEIAYPILGLLTDMDAWTLSEEKKKLNGAAREQGCTISIPFMFLSFICLAAIPSYAVTDHGFIDVMAQAVVDPVQSVE